MQIYVVRHAETLENRDGIIQGHLPGRLTDEGRAQARELGAKLADHGPFDRIISSDLARAMETAEILCRQLPPCRVFHDSRLRERRFGPLEGQSVMRLKRLLAENKTDLRGFDAEGVERYEDFARRVMECFDEVISDAPDRKIILVTHGGAIDVILQKASGKPARIAGNCEVFQIKVTGGEMEFNPL